MLKSLLTYSFPCTDLSVAGKMEGMSRKDWERGKATRSGLLWEVERLLKELPKEQLPDILLMENVPQVHSEQNRGDFESWLTFLRKRGYHNFWQDMNATDYGVAQNRKRCFCVSVLSDDFVEYEFPKIIPLETVLEDYLETDVDSKFFITSEKANKLIDSLIKNGVLPAIEQRIVAKKTLKGKLCSWVVTSLMNYRRIDTVGNSVAKTLTARDSEGFGTGFDVQNGVIECKTK